MRDWQVRDVMTTDVVTVGETDSYRRIVTVLMERRISAVPVIDDFGYLRGVVSEADLLPKVELLGQPGEQHPFRRLARRTGRRKGAAGAAAELMTAPAVATTSGTTLAAAAELMEREQVRRLPVIDGLGRVVGIVTRGDLLRVFLRPDADIRHDVVHGVLRRVLAVEPAQVGVEVRDGVVTLTGRLDRRSSVEIAGRLAARVGGVVEVHNELGYDFDDQDLPDVRPWPSQPIGVA